MSKQDDNCKLEASIGPHVTTVHCNRNIQECLPMVKARHEENKNNFDMLRKIKGSKFTHG